MTDNLDRARPDGRGNSRQTMGNISQRLAEELGEDWSRNNC